MKRSLKSSRDVILRTNNLAKAIQFYNTTLGLFITHNDPTLVGFETGSFCLYMEKGKSHGPVFEFLVQDVTAEKKRLLAAGCKLVEEDPSVPRCYLKDPFGLVFNIGRA